MGISVAATEANATLCITELRRVINSGGTIQWPYVRMLLDQLESATVNNLSARTDVVPDTVQDGRNTEEAAAIA